MQMGKTKVFLQRGAFDTLEHLRGQKLDSSASKIQAYYRMFFARDYYKYSLYSISVIQKKFRGFSAYNRVKKMRQEIQNKKSSTIIQREWRCYVSYSNYSLILFVTRWCQRWSRGKKARSRFQYLYINWKVTIIQKSFRMMQYRSHYLIQQYIVFNLQQLYRSKIAKKKLKHLRAEAKDLFLIGNERDQLKKEAAKMRQLLKETKRKASEEGE